MKKKLGILVKNVESSDLTFAITQFVEKHQDVDVVIFYKNLGRPYFDIPCPQISIADLYGFYGSVVATDLDTARILINSIGPYQKIFYPWDLEWLRLKMFNYKQLNSVYNSSELVKVARSDDHADQLYATFDAHYDVELTFGDLLDLVEPSRDYLTEYLGIDQFYEPRQRILSDGVH